MQPGELRTESQYFYPKFWKNFGIRENLMLVKFNNACLNLMPTLKPNF